MIETSEVVLSSEQVDVLLIDAPAAADNVKASSGAIGIQVCCAGPNSYNVLKESLSSAGVEEGTSCYISSQENGSRDVGNLFEQYHEQRANVFSRD